MKYRADFCQKIKNRPDLNNVSHKISSTLKIRPNYKFCLFTDLDYNFDNNEDFITNELERQQRRMAAMTKMLDQQHQMLRLIIQKMEIKTEADDVDEGVSSEEKLLGTNTFKWNSPRIRNKLTSNLSFNRN